MNDNAMVPAEDTRLVLGQTQLRPEDWVPPRVKIAQQMSKEVADEKAKPGDFYNTLTGEDYGPSLRIQPILAFMQRVFLVREGPKRDHADEVLVADGLMELTEGDGLKCRSFDMIQGQGEPGILCAACPLSHWTQSDKKKNVPPICTETYNVAAANELGELVILSFSRSSAKVGKRFFSTIRMMGAVKPWTRFFDLATHQERNDLGNFYVPDFKPNPERPTSDLIAQAVFWAEQLAGVRVDRMDVTPDDEGTQPEDNGDGAGDPDDPDAPF
jgi:hypothetical protein